MPGGGEQPTEEKASEEATTTATSTVTPTVQEVSQPDSACIPTVTTTTVANVRNGPGLNYGVVGTIPQGGKATVNGKSYDGQWWYIQFAGSPDGHAWVSNLVTAPECIPDTLASIAAPPAPAAPPTEEASNNNDDGGGNNDQPAPTATATQFLIFIPPGGFQFASPTPTFIIFIPPGGFPVLP